MPFIITEPQRIDGTTLAYSVYNFSFSFDDHFPIDRKFDQKIVIFKLKNFEFLETEKVVFQMTYRAQDANLSFVDDTLKKFIDANPKYVYSREKVDQFFAKNTENKSGFCKS